MPEQQPCVVQSVDGQTAINGPLQRLSVAGGQNARTGPGARRPGGLYSSSKKKEGYEKCGSYDAKLDADRISEPRSFVTMPDDRRAPPTSRGAGSGNRQRTFRSCFACSSGWGATQALLSDCHFQQAIRHAGASRTFPRFLIRPISTRRLGNSCVSGPPPGSAKYRLAQGSDSSLLPPQSRLDLGAAIEA